MSDSMQLRRFANDILVYWQDKVLLSEKSNGSITTLKFDCGTEISVNPLFVIGKFSGPGWLGLSRTVTPGPTHSLDHVVLTTLPSLLVRWRNKQVHERKGNTIVFLDHSRVNVGVDEAPGSAGTGFVYQGHGTILLQNSSDASRVRAGFGQQIA